VTVVEVELTEPLGVVWLAASFAVMFNPEYGVALAVAPTLPEEHVSVFDGLCVQLTKLVGKLFGVKP
jgi:hypothetical protein